MVALWEEEAETGLSLVLSPEDRLLDLALEEFIAQVRPEGLFLFLPATDDEQEAVIRRLERW
jgi:hypothetical protein